ncbi:hypothetical protein [Marinomonas sp. PE14-40]|uniref:hypothetical protein n=1 Tax=Marinomonas sp. PE14-40 TaxID=3060621 RepID=UPI003F67910F
MSHQLENALASIKQTLAKEDLTSELSSAIEASFAKNSVSLDELIQAREEGELTLEEFQEELEREKQIQEAELLTLQVAAKAKVQKVMDAVFDALLSGLK